MTDYFRPLIPPLQKTMGMPVDESETFMRSSASGLFAHMFRAASPLRKMNG